MKPSVPQLSEADAAEYLSAKPQTLRTWRHRGIGPAYLKIMGRIKYEIPALDAFVEASRVEPGKTKAGRGQRNATKRGSR